MTLNGFMLKGDRYETYNKISGWTLGKVVCELEKLDNSDSNHFLSGDDYNLLRSITNERNYLIHQIFRDFLYEKNCLVYKGSEKENKKQDLEDKKIEGDSR